MYVGEQSRTIRIWKEEAALASFFTHSVHTSACTLSAVTLRPEEGFAIPLSLTVGRRLCHPTGPGLGDEALALGLRHWLLP